MNKHRNYLSGVSVGMIAFGTLAVGLSTALPAVGQRQEYHRYTQTQFR